MDYGIIFNPDGTVELPDLPEELIPTVEALGFSVSLPPEKPGNVSKFRHAREIKLSLTKNEITSIKTDDLWSLHSQSLHQTTGNFLPPLQENIQTSLLDIKVELARRQLEACRMCELRCGVNRWNDHKGICGARKDAHYGGCFLNWSEEKHITPGIMIYLSGCNWNCVYCQYPQHLPSQAGYLLEPQKLSKVIDELWRQGGRTIHWVGGNPDQSLWPILSTLQSCQADLPIVWNSNGFLSEETLELLNGVVDTYLIDFRYWDDACALRYGAPPQSRTTIQRNLCLISNQKTDLIVRHLQLPGHFKCCTKLILHWIKSQLPEARLNLMHGQYRPEHFAYQFPEINRRLTVDERKQAEALAKELDIEQVE